MDRKFKDGEMTVELNAHEVRCLERTIPIIHELAFCSCDTDLGKTLNETVMGLKLAYDQFRPAATEEEATSDN